MSILQNKRIVITRADSQADIWIEIFAMAGVMELLYPCVAIAPLQNTSALDAAIFAACVHDPTLIVFTSVNAVQAVRDRVQAVEMLLPGHVLLGAVGGITAHTAKHTFKRDVLLFAQPFNAESLAQRDDLPPHCHVLLPQSSLAKPIDSETLLARGLTVETVTAYHTVIGRGGDDIPARLARGEIDAFTFASPSAIQFCIERVTREGGDLALLRACPCACIGETTAQAARDNGFSRVITARLTSAEGTLEALEHWFSTGVIS
jgi:uroporphyrinogen-III synthase